MPDKIEVIIDINDYPFDTMTPTNYVEFIYKKLVDAGIPVRFDGTVDSGRIYRLDDPTNLTLCRYVWEA